MDIDRYCANICQHDGSTQTITLDIFNIKKSKHDPFISNNVGFQVSHNISHNIFYGFTGFDSSLRQVPVPSFHCHLNKVTQPGMPSSPTVP